MSSDGIAGKLVLVTGGASGIGQGCCRILAKQGATVIVADLNEHAAMSTKDELMKTQSNRHSHFKVDVTSEHAVQTLSDLVIKQYGKPPEAVINSAGWSNKPTDTLETSEDTYTKIMDINVKGTFFICKIFLKAMKQASYTSGSFVNLSSIAKDGYRHLSVYAASKAAVEGFTKSLAKEYGGQGFRFNAVAPGLTNTPLLNSMIDEAYAKECIKMFAIGRMAMPEEIGQVCVFLASDASSYVNGATVVVNGGKF